MMDKSKLDEDLQGKPADPTHCHGMIGSLMYITSNRPDLVFAVCMCAWYQAKPTKKHLHAVKQIFRYLKGTIDMDLIMKQDKAQQAAHDEKLVPTEDRVKIVKSNLRMDPTITQKEETYQFWYTIEKVKKSSFYQFDIDNKTCQIDVELFRQILNISLRVLNQEFTVLPSHDSLKDFLLELGYKGQLRNISVTFVDQMHQPLRAIRAIINRCLSGKTSSNDRL
ncbi:hypothetical protein Tco_0638112 [Tanacetum coccineum]